MLMTSIPNAATLSADMLINRTFTFRSETADTTISDTVLLHPNGIILGYTHSNERYWEVRDNQLLIIDNNGQATCKLQLRPSSTANLELAGNFHDPDNQYAQTNIVHTLSDLGSDYHTTIQSFDLFDTLVARHCFDPLAVFRNIEEKYGLVNFADKRHALEMSIFGRQTYGLDDIYNLMIADGVITAQQAEVLKAMELQEEWDMLFPIAEVLAYVGPDDIIISDMYLPQPFIERVLREKCGLNNALYLSNYGKHSRVIWPALAQTYKIRTHYGDNWHADIVGAAEAGIAPTHVQTSKWLPTEEIFHSMGLGTYAATLRQLRLECHHRDITTANILNVQATINLPFMLLGSLWLLQYSREAQIDKFLTCARDCNLLHDMINSKHFARYDMPLAHYTSISRATCNTPSPVYEAYFRSLLGQRNLLIDIVGTGTSLKTLIERLNLGHRVQSCVLVADTSTPVEAPQTKVMMYKDFYTHRMTLEMLNASTQGSACGAMIREGKIEVKRLPLEYSPEFIKIIELSRTLSNKFITSLDQLPAVKQLPDVQTLEQVAGAITDILPSQKTKLHPLFSEFSDNMKEASKRSAVS